MTRDRSSDQVTTTPQGWSRQDVLSRVAELEERVGWYQDIDLGSGIHTKSRVLWGEAIDHPRQRWGNLSSAVPADLTGKSVLDIGCNAGYLALEAKKRGADYVLGIDVREGYIEQGRFCADVLGLDVDFQQLSIYDLDTVKRQFDLVFFVGILYHCKYLSTAVEKVASVSGGTVIVESAIDPMESDVPYVRFIRSSRYAGPRAEGSGRLPGHWHPNMTAMEDLFYEVGFSSVERLFKEGGRGGVVARR
jgi:tRNA (mo5U34)-methyltransferase